MIEIDTLKELAAKLEFTMTDEEYKTLQGEFEVMLKQMDRISKIDGISEVEPLTHPFPTEYVLKDDDIVDNLTKEEVLSNAKSVYSDMILVPKVVGEENE